MSINCPEDLADAIKSGDTEKARELLSAGAWEVSTPITLHGDTLVHEACQHGHLEAVKMLSEMGAGIEKKDRYGRTPILVAAKANQSKIVIALATEFGCNVNVEGDDGTTLLHEACRFGDLELAQVLIGKGADITAKDSSGCTPVLLAARENNSTLVIALITEFGCDVNDRDSSGATMLHLACEKGNEEILDALLHCKALNLSLCVEPGSDRRTPLFHAIRNKHEKVALELIDKLKSAELYDPNASCKGMPILHMACAMGQLDLVKTLANDGANLNVRDFNGNVPLVWTVRHKKSDIARELLARNSDPNIQTNSGVSVLEEAYKLNDVSMISILAAHGAKFGVSENSPLILAIRNNQYEVVKEFLNFHDDATEGVILLHFAILASDFNIFELLLHHYPRAKVDAQIESGDLVLNTPCSKSDIERLDAYARLERDPKITFVIKGGSTLIHSACDEGDIRTLSALFHRDPKAKVDVKNKDGDTPLHLACRRGMHEMSMILLEEYSCDPNIENLKGLTAFYDSCTSGCLATVQALLHHGANARGTPKKRDASLMGAVLHDHPDIVEILVNKCGCDIGVQNSQKGSLVHITAASGKLKVMQMLINVYGMSVSLTDERGNTPLHLAAMEGQYDCAQSLLYEFKAPVYMKNKLGKSPSDLMKKHRRLKKLYSRYVKDRNKVIEAEYSAMEKLAASRYSGSHCVFRLFVLGHPGAGKSSLVETLKRGAFFQSFTKVTDKLVPLHTAGIIPSIHTSDIYGRVQFYDFAGDPEYYSSHAAILERLFLSDIGVNVFVIVVNLEESEGEIEGKFAFWYSFIRQNSKKLRVFPFVIAVGSHADLLPSLRDQQRKEKHIAGLFNVYETEEYFTLDCRKPRLQNIKKLRRTLQRISSISAPYMLSYEASVLLGLLEKDFSEVTACPAETLISHIKEINLLRLPRTLHGVRPLLKKLQAIGALLILGGKEKDCYLVLNIAQLTNEVHKKLFSEESDSVLAAYNIGLLPPSVLSDILPEYITRDCLTQLQYCQEISHVEVIRDQECQSLLAALPDKSVLFFPALCKVDKTGISWERKAAEYRIGWVAQCANRRNYFPQRFLHVLLLRIVLRFTPATPSLARQRETHGPPGQQHMRRRCSMWKTGVHWLMEEGVECEVDVDITKEVAVRVRCEESNMKSCFTVFNSIVSCVMETKAEFCHSVPLQFFLLDGEDNLYIMEEVERCLLEGKNATLSTTGKASMSCSKLQHIGSTFWNTLFSMEAMSVCKYLQTIVKEWFELGTHLNCPHHELSALEVNHCGDIVKQKEEMIAGWLNSNYCTHSPSSTPCWWTLVKALKEMGENACAAAILADHGEAVNIQKKLLECHYARPDKDFLKSLSGVVKSKWPYLAALLSLSSADIQAVRAEGEGLSGREQAFLMLSKWSSKEGTTYDQLFEKLKPKSLFQLCECRKPPYIRSPGIRTI